MNDNMVVIVKAFNAYNVSKSPNTFVELFNRVIKTVKTRCEAFSSDDKSKANFRQTFFNTFDDFTDYAYEQAIVEKMIRLCDEAMKFYDKNENVKKSFEDMREQLCQISFFYETFDHLKNDWLIEALVDKYAA